jgi:manganese/zinc/iron transport system permease protein
MSELLAVLLLRGGYNTTVVMLGSAALGLACGAVGVFAMLRRQALVSDAVAHATLPGIAGGFLVGAWLGLPGRQAGLLMAGAAVTAALAAFLIPWLARRPRVTEDTATAAVLAAGFGAGLALLSVVQSLDTGGQAGLDAYLLGSTAGMLQGEAAFIGGLAVLVLGALALVLKELAAAAFDPVFARASGLPVARLDALVSVLSLACVVTGLRVVGLVLVVALLVIPAAAARFWSDRIGVVVAASAGIGAASAYAGAALSAVEPNMPTGAVMVCVAAGLFVASLAFGSARGLAARAWRARRALTAGGLAR